MSTRRLSRELSAVWGAVSVAAALFVLRPGFVTLLGALPECPFHRMTGLPCLACGSGRALAALARGEPGAALESNPLAAAGALLFVAGGVVALVVALAGRGLREPLVVAPRARFALAAMLAANWAYLVWAGR